MRNGQYNLAIGWAIEDITPKAPVSLYGQYYDRISQYVQSELKVTALAIENTADDDEKEQVIMVSMDLIYTLRPLQDRLKEKIKSLLPDFDVRKLFLNATHTHSGPYPDVESEYGEYLLGKLVKVVTAAWKNRREGGISAEYGYAVIGHNRRVLYSDGTAEMYGSMERKDCIGLEGPSDPGVDMLFCWDSNRMLTGIIVNVSCPAQVTESKYFVSADFWSEVRTRVNKIFSKEIFILPQCGAAGDISPRDLATGYKAGEPNMWDVPGMVEIGKRLSALIANAYAHAEATIETSVIFKHLVKDVELPTRIVSAEEYQRALNAVREIRSREPKDSNDPATAWNRFLQEIRENEKTLEYGPWDNKASDFGILRPMELVVKQYESQHKVPTYAIEMHVLRLGEIAMATNPFELFVDYGLRITARSRAKQTFIVQFSGDSGGYLPTTRAIAAGGYSAMANFIGPPGGDILVNETVNLINSLWNH